MKLKQAIKIIEEQKQKVLSPDYPKNDEWIVETASYIKDFFGFESIEYSRIAQFKWHVKVLDTTPKEKIKQFLEQNTSNIVIFLDNCKRTLKNKGLYKVPKNNFLSDKSNLELLSIILGICVFIFGIGYWTKKFEVFSVVTRTEKSAYYSTYDSLENETSKNNDIEKCDSLYN
ncbi:MAG TPA: hypothetical protein DDX39_01675 [Bacteroidales bacterium]|nr:MAG: hypothetical protein A2W98_07890 [Bacteroidetes bacterium GWF2_33_38]OFY72880.1 MAG: hypothetical protein A2265_01635 [Bacteroidetes bacterium RIFOXYA12_FULL_33_9]OFY92260.1 MAG: hypothetical protein A2236_09145 [Bacteroidetes bacterium RIFOXYA2_FULL_33_7]HBF87321.1 hypothetical protein [Bacteroidales bacterium]